MCTSLMKYFCLLLIISTSLCWEGVDDSDVLVLTEKNFASTVNGEELVLVEFYAPWCGHCKHLAPEYAKAATQLKAEGITLAKVDATEEQSLTSKHGVSGYPTLKLFRNGAAFEYKGPREAKGIVEYMRKQVGPSSKLLSSVEEADKLIQSGETVIVGFFESDSEQRTFLKAADELREKFKFAHTKDETVIAHYNHRSEIVIFRGDGTQEASPSKVSQSALTEWIYKNSLPAAGVVTKANVDLYQKKGMPLLKLLVDIDIKANKKQVDYYLNRLRKTAKEYPGLSFALADRKEFADDHDKFGLRGSEPHQMVIEDFQSSDKFKSKSAEKFSVDHVKEFAEQFTSKTIKPFIKSEPVPAPSQPGEVTVVVGETFKDIVLDSSKDVLIELYAPWCGHCKSLAPKYEELAKEFKDVSNVVIAKMDATANDSPHSAYQAKGFPTILYAPANNKDSPVKYEGEREVKAMKKFVIDKGATTAELKGKKTTH